MQSTYHIPVLLHEVIDSLQIRPDGVYVDCTFGGGGHARAILEQLGPNGKLIAFDQDADAQQNLPK
ncbi:MAG: 16S rRNA (cytosine(1402)-N(4))-methyltransferase, partial [Chitinophagaceae bacterium]